MLGSPRLEATNQMNQKRSKMFHVLVAAGRSLLSSSAEDWQRINLFLPENEVSVFSTPVVEKPLNSESSWCNVTWLD